MGFNVLISLSLNNILKSLLLLHAIPMTNVAKTTGYRNSFRIRSVDMTNKQSNKQ